jgi:hypothetical protein
MSEFKRGKELQEDTLQAKHQSSIWNEDYWLVILIRALSPPRFVLLVLFWPFVFFVVYGSLNYSGFCFKELRYLTNEEQILRAITEVSVGRCEGGALINAETRKVDLIRKPMPYESVDAFLKKNPDCCMLIPKNGIYGDEYTPPSFWDRVFGYYNHVVTVKYVQKYFEIPVAQNGEKGVGQVREKYIEGGVYSGNCGQSYGRIC